MRPFKYVNDWEAVEEEEEEAAGEEEEEDALTSIGPPISHQNGQAKDQQVH